MHNVACVLAPFQYSTHEFEFSFVVHVIVTEPEDGDAEMLDIVGAVVSVVPAVELEAVHVHPICVPHEVWEEIAEHAVTVPVHVPS